MPGVPLRDVCAVWREINLFGHWIPAVHTARVLRWFGPAEFLLWLDVWLGVLYRDVVAYGFGVDLLHEGKIVIMCQSVDASEYPGEAIPPPPRSLTGRRALIRQMRVMMEPVAPDWLGLRLGLANPNPQTLTSTPRLTAARWRQPTLSQAFNLELNPNRDQVGPDCTRCALVVALDLRVPLPQRMIDFVVRNVVGVFFYLQARAALVSRPRKYSHIRCACGRGPRGTHGDPRMSLCLQARAARKIARGVGPHAEAIRNDREFYERWLQPKLERHLTLKKQREAAKT